MSHTNRHVHDGPDSRGSDFRLADFQRVFQELSSDSRTWRATRAAIVFALSLCVCSGCDSQGSSPAVKELQSQLDRKRVEMEDLKTQYRSLQAELGEAQAARAKAPLEPPAIYEKLKETLLAWRYPQTGGEQIQFPDADAKLYSPMMFQNATKAKYEDVWKFYAEKVGCTHPYQPMTELTFAGGIAEKTYTLRTDLRADGGPGMTQITLQQPETVLTIVIFARDNKHTPVRIQLSAAWR